MGFRQFSQAEYADLAGQHNIIALVGNGFDIQVTSRYGEKLSPRYESFYYYLKAQAFDSSNVVVREMERVRACGLTNWSDIESAIGSLLDGTSGTFVDYQTVHRSTLELQAAFSEYLQRVASASLLARLGDDSAQHAWAIRSMSRFTQDVSLSSTVADFRFPGCTNHYHLFNFLFLNFNYTPLLDDYIYPDQRQWDPHQHRYADRNFGFYPNPASDSCLPGNNKTRYSTYLRCEVLHPHGQQSVPRSLLFGIDAPDNFDRGNDPLKRLRKPYWARNDIEFGHLFRDARLFIIFGCSIGLTDGWWWRRIADAIVASSGLPDAGHPELLIYWWSSDADVVTEPEVRSRFLTAAGIGENDPRWHAVAERVHVILYGPSDSLMWLSTAD